MNSAGNALAAAALRATERGDYSKALELYAEAASATPRHSVLLYNYASLARITGKLELAHTLLNQVIELNPVDTAAWHMRSNLRRWSPEHNHIAGLTALAEGAAPPPEKTKPQGGQPLQCKDAPAQPFSPKQKVEIHYALAKEYEDCREFAKAKHHLLLGASLRRKHLRYDLQDDLDTLAALSELAGGAAPPAGETKSQGGQPLQCKDVFQEGGCPPCKVIFIVGLPRVGSTLLERMLGCDEKITMAGELPFFPQLLGRALQRAFTQQHGANARPKSKSELVRYATQIDWQALGRDYLQQLPSSNVIIDKLPLNFLNIGFIQRALPNAKIIYMHRDQQDHELALMKHLFNQAYPWSYQLNEIRQYYCAAHKLCEIAEQQPQNSIFKLSYEDLVTAPEETLAAVADYCQLDWNEEDTRKALKFNSNNSSASTTGSASQVRSGLHQRSVGLAKHYDWPEPDSLC